jgi:hypothetical protein
MAARRAKVGPRRKRPGWPAAMASAAEDSGTGGDRRRVFAQRSLAILVGNRGGVNPRRSCRASDRFATTLATRKSDTDHARGARGPPVQVCLRSRRGQDQDDRRLSRDEQG